MEKKKKELKARFKRGVNLPPDDRRFEEGDEMPQNLPAEVVEALLELDAITFKEKE